MPARKSSRLSQIARGYSRPAVEAVNTDRVSFSDLLRQLGQVHDHEVRSLKEDLHHFKDEANRVRHMNAKSGSLKTRISNNISKKFDTEPCQAETTDLQQVFARRFTTDAPALINGINHEDALVVDDEVESFLQQNSTNCHDSAMLVGVVPQVPVPCKMVPSIPAEVETRLSLSCGSTPLAPVPSIPTEVDAKIQFLAGTDVDEESLPSADSDMSRDFWGCSVLERWLYLTKAVAFRAENETILFQVHNAWAKTSEDCEAKLRAEKTALRSREAQTISRRASRRASKLMVNVRTSTAMEAFSSSRVWRKCQACCAWVKNQKSLRRFIPPFAPDGTFRSLWDAFGFILTVFDLIMIPLTMAFDFENLGFSPAHRALTDFLDTLTICFWSLDMCLCFLTGFYTAQGFLEMNSKAIAKQYLRSWFGLDVFVVSADLFTIITQNIRMSYFRLGKIVTRLPRFFRIFRLMRLFKANERFKRYLRSSNSELTLTLFGLGKMLTTICIVNHYLACTWFFIGDRSSGHIHASEAAWVNVFLPEGSTIAFSYFTALHWSLTQFTPASMPVAPQNVGERVFNVLVIIVGMVTFSSFVSSITNAMTHIRHVNAARRKEDSLIRKYFQVHNISNVLATRTWYNIQAKRKQQIGKLERMVTEQDVPVMLALPERMLDELRLERFSSYLMGHPLFLNTNALWPELTNLIIREAVSDSCLPAREEFIAPGREVTAMFIVSRGLLKYVTEYAESDYHTVKEGAWACEIALWSIRATVAGSFVTCGSGCDVVLIQAAEFHRTIRTFPDVELRCIISKYAERFVAATNAAAVDWMNEDMLRNVPEDILEMYEQAKEEVGEVKHTVQELFVMTQGLAPKRGMTRAINV
eukprot:TRINITY_DN48397_c0_g1_i1.p1 TRINITY_DN48397_c0_g1~~TRINITY_DN48397_c0_g1_i1.p1  ORF type:complete len:869 (+),score=142.95 TRINITY_DN48397_c0_g1_i1:141-2747(+)